ncbi:hypothetical protein EDB19DRAFT_836564 [Suillus lakei]|nr:hypothetical protein EDB19DRAFT_836564 [Suillus lakei]
MRDNCLFSSRSDNGRQGKAGVTSGDGIWRERAHVRKTKFQISHPPFSVANQLHLTFSRGTCALQQFPVREYDENKKCRFFSDRSRPPFCQLCVTLSHSLSSISIVELCTRNRGDMAKKLLKMEATTGNSDALSVRGVLSMLDTVSYISHPAILMVSSMTPVHGETRFLTPPSWRRSLSLLLKCHPLAAFERQPLPKDNCAY